MRRKQANKQTTEYTVLEADQKKAKEKTKIEKLEIRSGFTINGKQR